MLQLKKPLLFLDLETTGLDRETDKIIQIAFCKLNAIDGFADQVYSSYVNPQIPITEGAFKVHGITNEMLKDAPIFSEIAGDVFEFMVGCDLAGYNSNYFDIPLLKNELARCGIILDPQAFHMVDVGNLFKIKEPRNLASAVRFYVDPMQGNFHPDHDARTDASATAAVFRAQLKHYPDLPATVEELALLTNYGQKVADLSGKFVYNTEGSLLLNFGKHKGKPAHDHFDFIEWMYYRADFAHDTRAICEQILNVVPQAEGDDDTELPF